MNTLLYCLGEEAEDLLRSTNITEDERKVYLTVLGKFDGFFQVRKNIIFERAKLNRRCQLAGETADQFIASLYNLAENCNYGDLKGEMIRDRLVVGIRDMALSEKLQLDADLTLERAKTAVRQREAVQEHQSVLIGDRTSQVPIAVDAVQGKQATGKPRKPAGTGKPERRSSYKPCTRCGKSNHKRDKCPAREAICHKCQHKGHYSSQCFTRSAVDTVLAQDQETSSPVYLDTIRTEYPKVWMVTLEMLGRELAIKIDTGAAVAAISRECHELLGKPELQKPQKLLEGPDNQPLNVVGEFETNISHKCKSAKQHIFVVENLRVNLLGLPGIIALNLVAKIDTMTDYAAMIEQKFPSLFRGLGTFGNPYTIELKPDSKPQALYTARKVPLRLRDAVAAELKKMESDGIISRVDTPTPWCSGMVPVPKKSVAVCICVDLKRLNESIQREVYPLSTVDDTLGWLTGATVFSRLDANSGFWQVPLCPKSRLLTSFITPCGRFCFNKLPFWIASAPKLFQKRMSQLLSGLEGIVCQMDDVLIFGTTREQHDARLADALERICSARATLNREKCLFGQDSLKFLGHVVNKHGISADPDKVTAIKQMKAP